MACFCNHQIKIHQSLCNGHLGPNHQIYDSRQYFRLYGYKLSSFLFGGGGGRKFQAPYMKPEAQVQTSPRAVSWAFQLPSQLRNIKKPLLISNKNTWAFVLKDLMYFLGDTELLSRNNEDSFVDNSMLSVQLADVSTRCSSHPLGKSKARCENDGNL